MNKGSSLFVSIGLKGLDQFERDLGRTEKALAKTGKNLDSIGRKMSMGITAPLMGIAAVAGKAAIDFNTAFKPVSTLLSENTGRVEELKKGVIGLALTTGKSANDLGKGFGPFLEKFGDSTDVIKKYEIVTKLAMVANTNLAASIDIAHDMADAYNDETLTALERTASLAAEARKLNVGFDEYARGMGTCAAFASTLGISQAELASQYITLVKATGNAELASTNLKMLYSQLIKPSAGLAKAIRQVTQEHTASGKALLSERGFIGALKVLKNAAEESGTAFDSMFKRAGALVAIEKFIQKAGELDATYVALKGSSGELENQFKGLGSGMSGLLMVWDKFKERMRSINIALGDELLKVLPDVVNALAPFMDSVTKTVHWFSELDATTKKNIIGSLAFAAAIGPIVLGLGFFFKALSGVVGGVKGFLFGVGKLPGVLTILAYGFKTVSAAITFLAGSPILLIVGAITGLILLIVKFHDKIGAFFGKLGEFFKGVASGVKSSFQQIERGGEDPMANLVTDVDAKVLQIEASLKRLDKNYTPPSMTIGPSIDQRLAAALSGKNPWEVWADDVKKQAETALRAIIDSVAALESPVDGTVANVGSKIDSLLPRLTSLATAFAASGDKLPASAVKTIRQFADIEAEVKAVQEKIEILKVIAPESATALEESFKRVDEALKAVNPYFDHYATNFGVASNVISDYLEFLYQKTTYAADAIMDRFDKINGGLKAAKPYVDDYATYFGSAFTYISDRLDYLFNKEKKDQAGLTLNLKLGYKTGPVKLSDPYHDYATGWKAFSSAVSVATDEMGGGLRTRFADMLDMVRQWKVDFTDTIVSALKTGNWDFKNFVDQVITDIMRLLAEVYLVQPIFSAFAAMLRGMTGATAAGAIVGTGVGNSGYSVGGASKSLVMMSRASTNITVIDKRTSSGSEAVQVKETSSDANKSIEIIIGDTTKKLFSRGVFDRDMTLNYGVKRRAA